jgi:hypothetical protein
VSDKHHFTLTVEAGGSRKDAEMAVLAAFASRSPDGCKFYLGGKDKPKPQKVPLGPEDVPPGSVFRMIKNSGKPGFTAAIGCNDSGVVLLDVHLSPQRISWGDLMARNQIKRQTDNDWQPCWKEVNHD